MNEILAQIIIPNRAVVKKNTLRHSLYMKDKNGMKIPRKVPVTYYTEVYKEWAKDAIMACINFKNANVGKINFPLEVPMNLSAHFIFDTLMKVDMSNLLEGVQDVLSGNAGVYTDSINKELYQIISDDSVHYICSLDNCRYNYMPTVKPHTIITLTKFRW